MVLAWSSWACRSCLSSSAARHLGPPRSSKAHHAGRASMAYRQGGPLIELVVGRQPVALVVTHLDLLEHLPKLIDGVALPSGDSCTEEGWP